MSDDIVDTHRRLKSIESRLETLETTAFSLSSKEFDADSYRQLIEKQIKNDVYERVRNLLAIVSLLAGLGFWVWIDAQVVSKVEDQFNVRQADLAQLLQFSRRDYLRSLLREATDGRSSWAITRIRDGRSEFAPLMDEMIKSPQHHDELQLLTLHALRTSDNALVVKLVERVLVNTAVPDRDQVVGTLRTAELPDEAVAMASEAFRERLDRRDGIWRSALRLLSSQVVTEKLSGLVALTADADNDIAMDALAFCVLNHTACAGGLPEDKFGETSAWIRMARFVANGKGITQENSELVVLAFRELELDSGDPAYYVRFAQGRYDPEFGDFELSASRLVAVKRHLAAKLIPLGESELLGEMSPEVYSAATWRSILHSFPNFGEQTASDPALQRHLIADLKNYRWKPDERRYERRGPITEAEIVERLEGGDLRPFLEHMRTGYFEKSIWTARVWPLFRDAAKAELFANQEPSPTQDNQDELSFWVDVTRLRWEVPQKRYMKATERSK